LSVKAFFLTKLAELVKGFLLISQIPCLLDEGNYQYDLRAVLIMDQFFDTVSQALLFSVRRGCVC
jgi:hypothetical protein